MLRVNQVAAVLLFGALTVVVGLQVLDRQVLHQSFIWSEEVARFLFFWVVMLGAALSVRARRHFVIDLTRSGRRAPVGWPALVGDLVPDVCVLAFSAFLVVQGLDYAWAGQLRTATNSHVSMVLVFAAIPAFAALSLVYSAQNVVADVRAFLGRAVPRGPLPPAE